MFFVLSLRFHHDNAIFFANDIMKYNFGILVNNWKSTAYGSRILPAYHSNIINYNINIHIINC